MKSIEDECFPGCSTLQSVEISQSVKKLPIRCCYNCLPLRSIIFHGQIESIENECFLGCSNLQSVELYVKKPYKGVYWENLRFASVKVINMILSFASSFDESCDNLLELSFLYQLRKRHLSRLMRNY